MRIINRFVYVQYVTWPSQKAAIIDHSIRYLNTDYLQNILFNVFFFVTAAGEWLIVCVDGWGTIYECRWIYHISITNFIYSYILPVIILWCNLCDHVEIIIWPVELSTKNCYLIDNVVFYVRQHGFKNIITLDLDEHSCSPWLNKSI